MSTAALLSIGAGVIGQVAPVVLAGVVAVGFAAYARASVPPDAVVEVDRTVDTGRPGPGDPVEVTLTVRNATDRWLADVRIVDGVPGPLSVVEGSPRRGTSLRAGGSLTFSYVVEARRGVHEFGAVTVLTRDVAGAWEAVSRIRSDTTIVSIPDPRPTTVVVPLRRTATQYVGRVDTASGGEGVEFFATRRYRPGDPMKRVDWNRRARTGELATLEFREERAATVIVVIDARTAAYVAPEPHAPHAVDRAVDAAGEVVESLLGAGNRIGVAAFGGDCWLSPGIGPDHRARVRRLLAEDPALSSTPPAEEPDAGWWQRLERRLPSAAQLVVLSPLIDAESVRFVRTLDAAGHPSTVISPDPTTGGGPGPLLATVARRVRITDLRRSGTPVIDWSPSGPLDVAIARQTGGRNR